MSQISDGLWSKVFRKKTVLCKDTPAFIANRVGVYSIMSLFHMVEELGLTVEEADKLSALFWST